VRRVLPALSLLSLAWAVVVSVTGGIDLHAFGFRLKSTYPDRPVYVAALLAAIYVYFFRENARRWQGVGSLTAAIPRLERAAAPIVVLLAIAVAAVGVRQGVLVAEASDAWGYISQADLWLDGDLTFEQPVSRDIPWPNADWTFAPLGYRPAITPGAIVPTYPPGLPVLMAIAKSVVGACGPFLIAPLLGGLTIWWTYLLGVRLSSRLIGLTAAVLLATSPIFLLMVLNPLSDVPATALLTLGLVLALSPFRWRAVATGAAVSMALFIRPNLLLVGVVFLTFVVWSAPALLPPEGGSHGDDEGIRRARLRALVWFAAGGAPLVLAVAVINTMLYGSPWSAGHGSLGELYSWTFAGQNLIDYSKWLWATETPFIALSLMPLIAWRRSGLSRAAYGFVVSFIAAVWLSYVFYRAYGLWLYLRFLLPIIPLLVVLASVGLAMAVRRISDRGGQIALALLVVTAALTLRVGVIRGEQVLGHWREGVPYTSVGEYVRQRLPSNAVVFTVQHSGSIRYYADRLTLRWDFLPADWWPRAVNVLTERGYRPYVLLTAEEDEVFRARFGLANVPDAPGTLVATFPGSEVNRLYDPLRATTQQPATIPVVRSFPCGCF
jgi:hypothetical protein